MGRLVCFIDNEGQVGTCLRDGNCGSCDLNDDAHKKWEKEISGNKSDIDLSHMTIKQLIDEICKREGIKEEFTPAGSRMIFIKDVGMVVIE